MESGPDEPIRLIFGERPSEPIARVEMTPQEALAGVTLFALASDGKITQERAYKLSQTLSALRRFRDVSPQDAHIAMFRILRLAEMNGVEFVLESAAHSLPPELHEPAYAAAAGAFLATADAPGIVDATERVVLNKIQSALKVTEPFATAAERIMRTLARA